MPWESWFVDRGTRFPDGLTEPERALWAGYRTGTRVELGTGDPADAAGWGAERTVRAEVIAALLLGACPAEPGHVPAVRLRGANVTGRLDLSGGEVGCELGLKECRLAEAPDFTNARARQIRISGCHLPGFEGGGLRVEGDLSLSGSVICGEIRLPRAQLSGFRMNGTKITNPRGWALWSGALTVEAGTFFRNADITGGVRMVGARLGGGFFLENATLRNPGKEALTADNVVVEDAMECGRGFTAEGTVRLRGARINGTLSFSHAALRVPADGLALHASHMQVDELLLMPREPIQGVVSLTYSRVGLLMDRWESWPRQLRLNGLTYDSLRGRAPERRLDWVSRDPSGFRPQPYEQLAAWFHRVGLDDLARKTLLAKQRAHTATLGRRERAWGFLLDWTVGYGYRPWLAALWFGVLLTVGTTAFTMNHPRALEPPGEQPRFNAFAYSLDLLVPIGAFGQREVWDPVGWTQWLAYALITSGWILATALIAGVTRMFRPT